MESAGTISQSEQGVWVFFLLLYFYLLLSWIHDAGEGLRRLVLLLLLLLEMMEQLEFKRKRKRQRKKNPSSVRTGCLFRSTGVESTVSRAERFEECADNLNELPGAKMNHRYFKNAPFVLQTVRLQVH